MQRVESLEDAIRLAKDGRESMTKCTHHDDGEASLHVAPGQSQPVVMTCHAGCHINDILMSANVDMQAILAERADVPIQESAQFTPVASTPAGPASHVYPYTDEIGNVLFEVLRIPLPGGKKTFRQRHQDPNSRTGWAWNMNGVRRVLYCLPDVIAAKAEGRTIYVVEGEKDAETLRGINECATTSPMGAGKWSEDYSAVLEGASVIIIADGDPTGRAHARSVRDSLLGFGCAVGIKEAASGKDITDHIRAGLTLAELRETVPENEEARESYGVDVLEAIKRTFEEKSYVIPNVLARGDRLLITGFEGHGKSTLLRQLGVQVAAGVHPWTGLAIEPQKVVIVDCENHPDQVLSSWQDLLGLAARHNRPMQPGQLTILEEWDNELDLTSEAGHAWLLERVHAYKPDLMIIGPLYNMSNRDLKDDETVRKIKKVVNEARGICGTAFIMEHHAPHRGPQDKERSVRPYGSSTFLKWPDFGYGLRPLEEQGVYEWQKTRFPRVRTRHFPTHLRWGKPGTDEWPWVPSEELDNGSFT